MIHSRHSFFKHSCRSAGAFLILLVTLAVGESRALAFQTPPSAAKTVNVRSFGARMDGATDDRKAIQAAIDSIPAGTVFLPAGTYAISPVDDGTRFLTLKPNITFAGENGTILKVLDGVKPYNTVLYASDCTNCVLESFTIDSNAFKNPVSSFAEIRAHSRREIALFGGTHIVVRSVTIRKSTAFNSIDINPNHGEIHDVHIEDCNFVDIGDDPNHVVHDSSSIYSHASDVVITRNHFQGRRGAPALVAAIEIHGSNTAVTDNTIVDYLLGMNISGVAEQDSVNNIVQHNTISGALDGILIWSNHYAGHTSGYGIDGLNISNNTIHVNQLSFRNPLPASADVVSGIALEPTADLPIRNVLIADNTVTFDAESSARKINPMSMGIGLWPARSALPLESIVISGNSITDSPLAAVHLTGLLSHCRIKNNNIRNAGRTLYPAAIEGYKAPIFISGAPMEDVEVSGNSVLEDLPVSRMAYAIRALTPAGESRMIRILNNKVTLGGRTTASFRDCVASDRATRAYVAQPCTASPGRAK